MRQREQFAITSMRRWAFRRASAMTWCSDTAFRVTARKRLPPRSTAPCSSNRRLLATLHDARRRPHALGLGQRRVQDPAAAPDQDRRPCRRGRRPHPRLAADRLPGRRDLQAHRPTPRNRGAVNPGQPAPPNPSRNPQPLSKSKPRTAPTPAPRTVVSAPSELRLQAKTALLR